MVMGEEDNDESGVARWDGAQLAFNEMEDAGGEYRKEDKKGKEGMGDGGMAGRKSCRWQDRQFWWLEERIGGWRWY